MRVEIKDILNKTSKGLLELVVMIGIIIINVQRLFKQSVFVNLCTALLITAGALGLFVVRNHLNNKQNNKSNAIAIGYITISILLMIKLYYDAGIYGGEDELHYSQSKVQLIIDLLEIAYIVIGIQYVSQHTNIKRYIELSGIILIGSLLISYRVNLLNVFPVSLFNQYISNMTIRIALILITIIFLFIFNNKDNDPCKMNRYRVLFVLILHVFYQGGYMLFQVKQHLIGEPILYIIKVAVYLNVFALIHDDTTSIMWRSIDDDLEDKTKKLADDIKQKTTLILVSEKLQEYIEVINTITCELKEKAEASKDLKRLKYINMITQNCYRLKKLTHNIRAINQIEKGDILPRFALVDIVSLLEQLIESIEPYANSMHIQMKFITAERPIHCYIDTDLIERIMLNLISNATKYNRENGSITIYVNTKKNNAYICIKDTGIGIPYDKLSTIFNRFERGDYVLSNKREGSGLGLPIVKSLIEIHKGSICMISKENNGTTVSIEFPRYRGVNPKTSQHDCNDKEALEQKIKVEFSDLKI